MRVRVKKTEYEHVDLEREEFLNLLGNVLARAADFNPVTEYINNGYICSDVKYHTWDIFERRPVTESDIEVQNVFHLIKSFLTKNVI